MEGFDFKPLVIAFFLMLMLAASFPFYIYPLDLLVEYIPLLPQFRSTGRFAWWIYYLFQIIAAIWLFNWGKPREQLHYSRIIFYLYALLLGVESIYITGKNPFTKDAHLINKRFNPQQYQAILALPLFSAGSEKFGFAGSDAAIATGFVYSFGSGLPLVDYSMSRTSLQTAANINQLCSAPYFKNKYFDALPSTKDFLLLVDTTAILRPAEMHIAAEGTYLYTDGAVKVMKISLATLKELNEPHSEPAADIKRLPAINYDATQFDSLSKIKYPFNDAVTLFDDSIEHGTPGDWFEASVWVSSSPKYYGCPWFIYTQYKPNGEIIADVDEFNSAHFDQAGLGIRKTFRFKVTHTSNRVVFKINGNKFDYAGFEIKKIIF